MFTDITVMEDLLIGLCFSDSLVGAALAIHSS